MWDVETFLHARTTQEGVIRDHADAKVRIVMYDDHSWDVVVQNDDASFSLMLRGDYQTRAAPVLHEMLSWVFGQPS